MNQILGDKFNKINSTNYTSTKKMKIIFVFSLFVILLCFIFYFFLKYNSWQKEKLSKNLANQFSIRNLYSYENDYTAKKISTNLENINPFVIGLLKIDKISLMYPILSTISEELLKISPCRFYGPMPNEVRKLMYCWSQLRKPKTFWQTFFFRKWRHFSNL